KLIDARTELKDHPQWKNLSRFVHGGVWRNFLVKYPEVNEMYTRMMAISTRLDQLAAIAPHAKFVATNGHAGQSRESLLSRARTELYRAQCNCPYWHGAFGGIYLPHLRNAIYQHLITADGLLDQIAGQHAPWVEGVSDDFDLDDRPEVQLANDRLVALVAPSRGGQLYELDVRNIRHNLIATLSRRPEAYHRQVLAGPGAAGGSVIDANIPVKFKQAGLERHLQYDSYSRKSLLDHFYDEHIDLDALENSQAQERGDFLAGPFETKLRRSTGKVQVQLSRAGNAWGVPLKITKGLTLQAGSNTLEI